MRGAKGAASCLILDVEKFKATVTQPQGMDDISNMTEFLKLLVDKEDGDEYFHLTCH